MVLKCTYNQCLEQKYQKYQIFPLKFSIFKAEKNLCIQHGHVFINAFLTFCKLITCITSCMEACEGSGVLSSEGVGLMVAGSGWGGECD